MYVQAMVHSEFNDDLERFPYNRGDGADIDEVLNVGFSFILVCIVFLIVSFGFRDFQHCRQPIHPIMCHNKIATALHIYSPSAPFRRVVSAWLTSPVQRWVPLGEYVLMVSLYCELLYSGNLVWNMFGKFMSS